MYREEHIKERIPGSLFFDLAGNCDKDPKLSYRMPTDECFNQKMQEIDVRKSDFFVVYDIFRNTAAPRAFWMLKTFGASDVYILNGTFAKWVREGRKIESGDSPSAFAKQRQLPSDFKLAYNFKKDIKKVALFEQIDKIDSENEKKAVGEQFPILDGRLKKNYDN